MADYFTQFSCAFSVGSAENAKKAEDIRGEMEAERDRDEAAALDSRWTSTTALKRQHGR